MTSKNIIKKKKLAIKIGDHLSHFATCEKVVEKLKIAIKEFKEAKSISFEPRKDFINEYIVRWAKDCKESPEVMKKMLQREDKQKKKWKEYLKIFVNVIPGPSSSKEL